MFSFFKKDPEKIIRVFFKEHIPAQIGLVGRFEFAAYYIFIQDYCFYKAQASEEVRSLAYSYAVKSCHVEFSGIVSLERIKKAIDNRLYQHYTHAVKNATKDQYFKAAGEKLEFLALRQNETDPFEEIPNRAFGIRLIGFLELIAHKQICAQYTKECITTSSEIKSIIDKELRR